MTTQKLIIWGITACSILFILAICNELFFRQIWGKLNHERIKQNMQLNYYAHKKDFSELIHFTKYLKPIDEVEFHRRGKVYASVNSKNMITDFGDSLYNQDYTIIDEYSSITDFKFLVL